MKRLLAAYLPQIAAVLALCLGAGMTAAVYQAEHRRSLAEFERVADIAVDRVLSRIRQQEVVLRSVRGLFAAHDAIVSRPQLLTFLETVDLDNGLSGMQGVGYAQLLGSGDEAKAEARIAAEYGVSVRVQPATDQPLRAPIVLLEPADFRNFGALGFDMYHEETRRTAMDRAIASGEAQMTGPVVLVQETTADKQAGFLIYLPYHDAPAGKVLGFVYAPFRVGDLIRAALGDGQPLPVTLRISDSGARGEVLYDDDTPAVSGGEVVLRTVAVMGRQWVFRIHETQVAGLISQHQGSLLVGVTFLLLSLAVGYVFAARQHEAAQAHAVAAAARRESDYRGLLLQEMKHRIKNHIARIQSISRQSARGATDMKTFIEAFDSRLQAMAAVQEVLAGTAVAQADLQAILQKELQQGLDTEEVGHLIDGSVVELDERQSHAFAMVAHELLTNAMKYGGLSQSGTGLRVTWRVEPGAGDAAPEVLIDWQERFAGGETGTASASTGFGSRLIEASLRGELSGTIERSFTPEGLAIRLRFPIHAHLQPGARPADATKKRPARNPADRKKLRA